MCHLKIFLLFFKVLDVEVFAFSECFLFSDIFNFAYTFLNKLISEISFLLVWAFQILEQNKKNQI